MKTCEAGRESISSCFSVCLRNVFGEFFGELRSPGALSWALAPSLQDKVFALIEHHFPAEEKRSLTPPCSPSFRSLLWMLTFLNPGLQGNYSWHEDLLLRQLVSGRRVTVSILWACVLIIIAWVKCIKYCAPRNEKQTYNHSCWFVYGYFY